jgi:hypothetical protein
LGKYLGQFVTVLQVGFTSNQSTFGLIRSQGTPPVWSVKLSKLEGVLTTAS